MTTEDETAVVVADVSPAALVQSDPTAALENTEKLVRYMSDRCKGPQFISNIQGRMYPRVEWWTTVGMTLGLLPVEVSSERVEEDGGHYQYLAKVEVRRGDQVVTSASAICSTRERSWGNRDEYAVKSMATTRATGKAYRIGLSAIAVMAGLEPTPADEIPPQGFSNAPEPDYGTCPKHGVAYFKRGKMKSPAHPNDDGSWCSKPKDGPLAPVEREQEPTTIQTAMTLLDRLCGAGQANAEKRADYVKEVIGRDINHPGEVTEEEWEMVVQSAEADLAG